MASLAELRIGAGPDGDGATPSGGWHGLAPGWRVLPGVSLAGFPAATRPAERRLALLHPLRGVVILVLIVFFIRSREDQEEENRAIPLHSQRIMQQPLRSSNCQSDYGSVELL